MDNTKMNLDGVLTLTLKKPNGETTTFQKHNMIVNTGFDFVCDAMGKGTSRPAAMGYIGIGSGTTAVDATQTELVSELKRIASTYAHTSGTKVFTVSAKFDAGVGTGAITEAGVFNAQTSGIMLDRVVFPVINKGAEDTLTAQFTFTLS